MPHDETNAAFGELSMTLGWAHRMKVAVFTENLITTSSSFPRTDTAVRPYAESVRVTPHGETNAEFGDLSMAVAWTHQTNVTVFTEILITTSSS
jgi:hypothetical protein